MQVEVCANSYTSAKAAQEGGADRIELCAELSVGGLSPSYGVIEKVTSELNIPVHVLIRPRSGNFSYTEAELDVMTRDIAVCKKMGCAGIVSGTLTANHKIDLPSMRKLLRASSGMEFTFHRAFDWCVDPEKEIQKLIDLGVNRLLSSGQQAKAIDGIKLLKQLRESTLNTIEIMPGGGINLDNALLFKTAGFQSVHLSASLKSQLLPAPPKISMHSATLFEEGIVATSNKEIIEKIIRLIS